MPQTRRCFDQDCPISRKPVLSDLLLRSNILNHRQLPAADQPGGPKKIDDADQGSLQVAVVGPAAIALCMTYIDDHDLMTLTQNHGGHEAVDMVEPRQVKIGLAAEGFQPAARVAHAILQHPAPDRVCQPRAAERIKVTSLTPVKPAMFVPLFGSFLPRRHQQRSGNSRMPKVCAEGSVESVFERVKHHVAAVSPMNLINLRSGRVKINEAGKEG